MVPVFSLSKKTALTGQNPAMTTRLISAFFLGTSAAQAIAADDLVEQCASVVTEPVCLPDPTMQQLIGESAVTSSRGKGKMPGKRMIQNPMLSLYKYNIQAYNTVLLFYVSQLCEIKYTPSSYYFRLLKV